MPSRPARAAAAAVLAVSLAACTSGGSGGSTPPTLAPPTAVVGPAGSGAPAAGSSGSRSASRTSSPAVTTARAVFDAMSLRQRVGQLLMVDCPSTGVSADTVSAITEHDVGSVILDGTTTTGAAAVRSITDRLQRYAPRRTKLFIATDQEGGTVQRLQGPGFSSVPAAIEQGALAPATLRADARTWGTQLKRAGVNVDLAPVLDTVPAGGAGNPPIGDLQREYGHDPGTVASHGVAAVRGLLAAGVAPTVKHFPGLGRVTGNTDVTAGVTDPTTTRTDPYLAPFRAAVRADVPFVMMSTAIYARIDPGAPAAFSPTIVTGMLRDDLGYRGLVISDDVGAADQVGGLTPGQRAVAFVQAGGDVVLTVVADQAAAMTAALVSRASSDRTFRAKVDAAALLVLQTKQRFGLL